MIVEVTGPEDLAEQVISGSVLVYFFTTECGQCKMLIPVLESIERDFEEGVLSKTFNIVKTNVSGEAVIINRYGVPSVPFFKYFKDGLARDEKCGYLSKSEILKWMDNIVP
jgi:thioredoxin 1